MNQDRISEILSTYRPGEDLESDPEVRQALDLAETDAEWKACLDESLEFDEAFRSALARATVPDGLEDRILTARFRNPPTGRGAHLRALSKWVHPASFGAAAAIIILLALSFTFWDRPAQPAPPLALAQDPITSTAQSLYASLNPSFKSRDGSAVREYLQSRNGITPASLPGDVVWDKAFACDVVEVDGYRVSIVCFKAPDDSRTMHLFTFQRKDFPGVSLPEQPQMRHHGSACCATWANDEVVHVLYSDKGEENLRALLDI